MLENEAAHRAEHLRDKKATADASWKKEWGKQDYGAWEKFKTLGPLFDELQKEGKIGELVVDVGSNYFPVSQHIPGKHKIITLDITGQETSLNMRVLHNETLHVRHDAEHVSQPTAFDSKRALVKIAEFLGVDSRNEKDRKYADTILFSEILNYVDFRSVLSGFSAHLKPGGRFIIINQPERGYEELFSEAGVKDNGELKEFLASQGFEIEKTVYPWRVEGPWSHGLDMIFLVARKEAALTGLPPRH